MITVFGIVVTVHEPSICARCNGALAVGDLAVLATPGKSLYCFKMYHKNPVPQKGAANGKEANPQSGTQSSGGSKSKNPSRPKNAR